ncbi:glycosyltransferase [Pseudoleptotrichia goodfellowii]|jgi:Glycosyltransferase|uniref:Glycosyltransferase, group 1 family protein n=1 Tax=Pseudoleptotrichia goodfellowii TaxID=157692 RepID=A0A510JDY8_9FUSO|nr:glycosyltransferase [Pseudoleptotrichia goodfellowii]BBM37296.1 glycosyltransferase, group 1 family protein [Pseudoleptotrichia goodfellowii]
MKKIVISGINLTEGGPLTIYKECLKYIKENLSGKYEITALVHNKNLFSEFSSDIEFIEFRDSKKSYLKRCYYEYFYFKKLSKKIKPYLWFSLHDMTPNVISEKMATYCHNPMIFYKVKKNKIIKEFKMFLFSKLYKYIYKINIKKNDFVIVQQNWMRKEFEKIFKINNIIVAHPNVNINDLEVDRETVQEENSFLYPAFPRIFKNFEVICEAVKNLEEQEIKNFKVYLTINGKENKYSEELYNKYKTSECIKFTGLLNRQELMKYYNKVENIIFPSKLETWGLPITETKEFNKPIILSDLKYAHETLGTYEKVLFFNPDSAEELSEKMKIMIFKKNIKYDGNIAGNIENPYCRNWDELFKILLQEK